MDEQSQTDFATISIINTLTERIPHEGDSSQAYSYPMEEDASCHSSQSSDRPALGVAAKSGRSHKEDSAQSSTAKLNEQAFDDTSLSSRGLQNGRVFNDNTQSTPDQQRLKATREPPQSSIEHQKEKTVDGIIRSFPHQPKERAPSEAPQSSPDQQIEKTRIEPPKYNDFTDIEHEAFLRGIAQYAKPIDMGCHVPDFVRVAKLACRSVEDCLKHYETTKSSIDYNKIYPTPVYKKLEGKRKPTHKFHYSPADGADEAILEGMRIWRDRSIQRKEAMRKHVMAAVYPRIWIINVNSRLCKRVEPLPPPKPVATPTVVQKGSKGPRGSQSFESGVSPGISADTPAKAVHKKCKVSTDSHRKEGPKRQLRERIVPSSKAPGNEQLDHGSHLARELTQEEALPLDQLKASQAKTADAASVSKKRKRTNDSKNEDVAGRKLHQANVPSKVTCAEQESKSGSQYEKSSKTKVKKAAVKKTIKKPVDSPTYVVMAGMAIQASPGQRQLLDKIYTWMTDKFLFLRDNAIPGWKNSVRHNLSDTYGEMKHCRFRHEPGPLQGDVKGNYWRLEDRDDKKMRELKRDIAEALVKLENGELKGACNYQGDLEENENENTGDQAGQEEAVAQGNDILDLVE